MKLKHLYTKLQSLYFLGLLLPLIISLCIFIGVHTHRMMTVEQRLYDSILSSITFNIETKMDSMSRCSLSWANQEAMMDFYKAVNENNAEIPTKSWALATEYRKACLNIMYLFSEVNPLGIGYYPVNNPEKYYYLYTSYRGLNQYISDFTKESWYSDTIASKGGAVFTNIQFDSNYPRESYGIFSIVRLVTDIETRKPLGIIKIDVSAEYFNNLFNTIDAGKYSYYTLHNNKGDVAYSTSKSHMDNESNLFGYSDYTRLIGSTEWYVCFHLSDRDQGSVLRSILIIMIIITIGTAFVSFSVYHVSSRQITEPLNQILETIMCASQGDYKKKIKLENCKVNEFILIEQQYNRMVDALSEHIEHEYIAKTNQQRAEFHALQMQINPHFLYNTLNCFVALNRIGARNKLEQAILTLTSMFHYTCSLDYTKSIKEEFDFIKEYLALQELRYQERLEWKVNLDRNCEGYSIPKLLVQPLVENSIIHGVEPVDRPVFISVSGSTQEVGNTKFIVIEVKDNGAGSAEVNINPSDKKRIGLDNIKKRLSCISEQAKMVSLIDENGAIFTIRIPTDSISNAKRLSYENSNS